ncbi:TPA: hypothetical protein N0F65_001358 [Lagenidium giganteum]|uniref:Uncharacterized protein n=1 Tax=Lagenidium giganteum TaxID=4803 RepID=A0AAV2YZP3_9STRA|nr:TPA: hypothetical protein N0F65_001358 [Lagenidium giganteum]
MGRGVTERIEDARKHGLLHLSYCRLSVCPSLVFGPDFATVLVRLDLSFNSLTTLPDGVRVLANLHVLWVNNNPKLTSLPRALADCPNLSVVDASETALNALPCELGRLRHLHTLEIEHTPLEARWIEKKHVTMAVTGDTTNPSDRCAQILTKLRRKDERVHLKLVLYEKLHDEVYQIERQDQARATRVQQMLQRVLKRFPLADELRGLIRNASRLFPPTCSQSDMENVDAALLRFEYDQLRQQNDMKKLGAELEIKIRNLYFDRIDPTTVEGMVKSIYDEIDELKDIKFLLKHAAKLFPKEAKDVDGLELRQRLRALQEEIARERAAAIDKLLSVVSAIYSDTEPDQVHKLVSRVAALFKNTKELRSLAADASALFPIEFLNANPNDIRAAFLRMKAEALGTISTAGGTGGTNSSSRKGKTAGKPYL